MRKEEYCETSEEAIKDIGKYLCKNNLATSRLYDILGVGVVMFL